MTPGLRSATDTMYRRAPSDHAQETVPVSATFEAQTSAAPKSANGVSLADMASLELEELKGQCCENENSRGSFPTACRALLQEMGGNTRCLDCSRKNPEWAAVSYGAMVCLQCAGSHRSLGVNVSTVRSVTMDHWRYDEVVKMLEGGNRQLSTFFQRHALGRECSEFQSPQLTSENIASMRYKTKAALFYRQQLEHHIQHLISQGPYKGRRRTKRRPLGTQASNLE